MRAKGWMIGAGVLDIALAAACVYLVSQQDRTAPVISFPEETAAYSGTMAEEELLAGVTAQDAVDGDVSDSLLVEKVTVTADGKAIVTYAALDRSHNVAKASRILPVKESAKELPEEPAEAEEESNPGNGTENGMQTEPEVGPEEGEAPEDGENNDNGRGGQQTDAGQGRNQEQPPDEAAGGQAQEGQGNQPPVLRLGTDTLTVPAGTQSVDWNACIASLSDDRDSRDTLYANLSMDGHVDLTTPGDYPVTLYTKDSDGAESEKVTVTVTVQ